MRDIFVERVTGENEKEGEQSVLCGLMLNENIKHFYESNLAAVREGELRGGGWWGDLSILII